MSDQQRKRTNLQLRVVLDAELPGDDPVVLLIEARGVDYFRAEDLTGIDPWEALGDLAGSSKLSNRFMRSLHALGYSAAKRVAPSVAGDSFDRFLDRASEVSVAGDPAPDDAQVVPDARPTAAAAGSE
jgi:hypothetical protein